MEDTYHRKPHCVYKLTYHLVFVVKYRKPAITREMGEFILRRSGELLKGWNGELLEGGFEADHVHLLISMDPAYELSKYVSALKQRLSREIRQTFPEETNKYLWGGGFWTTSYFIASTGGAPLDKVKEYVASQGQKNKAKTR